MNGNTSLTILDIFKVTNELKTEITKYIPDLVSALIVLVLGVSLSFFLKWLTATVIRLSTRVLPDKLSIRPGLKENVDSLTIGASRVVFFIVLFLTITTVLQRMGLEIISNWFQGLAKNLPNIIVALIILFLGWKLKDFLKVFIEKALARIDFSHSRLASNSLAWAVFAISALVALEQMGIDMGFIVSILTVFAGVISGGVALMFALGAKAVISDIIICYQISRFLKVGQRIEILGHCGTVEAIGPTFILLNTEKGQVNLSGSRFRQEVSLVLGGKD
jgi:hypothetical protein